jgi:hypothetical protein
MPSASGARSIIAIEGDCPTSSKAHRQRRHSEQSNQRKCEYVAAIAPLRGASASFIRASTVGKRFNHHILKFKDTFDLTEPPDYAFPWQRRKASLLRKRRMWRGRGEKPEMTRAGPTRNADR